MIEDRAGREPHVHTEYSGDGTSIRRSCEDATCFGTRLGGEPDLRRTPRQIANTNVFSKHPWDERTFVQGGGHGVVFSAGGARRTAFVEAFPRGTFIRGEGSTIEEADDACWAKLQRMDACPAAPDHGPFERRDFTNGAGYCTVCGSWFSKVFEALEIQGPRKPSFLERLFSDDDDEESAEERLDVIGEVLSAKIDADAETSRHVRAIVGAVLGTESADSA